MNQELKTIEIHGESSVDWQATAMRYIELNAQKTDAIQRVRELHHELEDGCCAHCVDDHASHWPITYCDTRKALDGEQ